MLSESFLCTAFYRQLMNFEVHKDGEKEKPLERTSSDKSQAKCVGSKVSSHRDRGFEPLHHSEPPGTLSHAVSIPRREALSDDSLDLYTSWSSRCGSIYKNYPDLHIAGDHILHGVVDSGCILDGDCEDGPVLVSADIDSSSPPNENPGRLLEGGVPPSIESHILPSAPLSNSVLNDFIEKKMQELYKQFYEEKLMAGTSLHPQLLSAILMHNVNQISLQISQEQNVDPSKAKDAVLQRLFSTTSGGSSEFITPILHISSQDNKAIPKVLSSNSSLIKSRQVQSKK